MSAFIAGRQEALFSSNNGLPQAIEVSGAGTAEANGVYRATNDSYCGAPVYEHMERPDAELKITREPHTTKSGAVKHGWLLGRNKMPLYGVPTEALAVPPAGWKKFQGGVPVPTVVVHAQLVDLFFSRADHAKTVADTAMEENNFEAALASYDAGIKHLRESGERFGDPFLNRAALLLSRRAGANAKLENHKAALRDAIAALELVRSLTSAEVIALESAKALGCTDDATARRVLEPVGTGRISDSGSPLSLRCVERWVGDLLDMFALNDPNAPLPEPKHYQSDRYLEDVDEETREAILRKHLPDYFKVPGGTGVVKDSTECLAMMRQWEEVFTSPQFQQRRQELWNRNLNYVERLQAQKELVATSLQDVLEPMGFAPGKPGLTRVVQQMQVYWSAEKVVAQKALDLEELADVSLADLE